MNIEKGKLKNALSEYQQAKRDEAERIERVRQEEQRRIEMIRAEREFRMYEIKRFLTEKVRPFAVYVGFFAGWIYLFYLAVCFTTSLGIDSTVIFLIDFVVRFIGSVGIVSIPFLVLKLSPENNFVALLIAVLALALAVMSYAYIP